MSTSFWWPEVPSGVAPWVYNASLGTRYIPGIGPSEVATQSLTTFTSLPAMTFSPFPTEAGRGGSGFGLGNTGNASFIIDDPWPSTLPPSPSSTNMTVEADDGYSLPEMVLITIVAGFLCLLTVVGNCMVMISFKIDKQLQTISNYFLFSLAVADFVVGFFSMPIFTAYILTGRWLLGPHLCDTWLAVDYLASNASVLNLLIISFDRYFSVTRPLTYRARRTPRRAGIMIAAAWVISLVLWPPWIYSWPYIEGTRTVPEGQCYIQFIETNNYITFGTAIAAFYVPVTVMCVLYWRIWRETEQRQKDLSNLQAGKKDDSHRSNSSMCSFLPCCSADDQPPLVTAVAGGVGVDLDEWRRSRSESSGALDDLETTYVPTAACLGQHPRGMQFRGTHQTLRTYLQIRLLQFWRYCTKRRSFFDPDGDEDLSYSDASNVVTPGSLDTPIQSSVSRCTSLNVIRDPYATATPTRYHHHPDVTTPLMEKLAWERNCNAKRKSDPFTLPSTPTTNSQSRVHVKRDVCLSKSCGGGSSNYSSGASNSLKQSANRGLSGSEQRLTARSHSADSVFTIVIRLPHESSIDSQEIPSIKMIPVSELFSSSNNQSSTGNGSQNAAATCRGTTFEGNTGNSISHMSRSRTASRISNETPEQYRRDSDIPSPPPCPRPRSVSQGRPALPATRYLPPPPDSPNEFYSTRINTPNSQRRNNPLTLCGTGCNLPAVNFPKLPLAKPTHLPIHTTTSPWVPRSVMPVAQSPLLTHPKRHSATNSNFVLAQDEDPPSPAILPLDARIIPKQLARPTSTGFHNQTHHHPLPSTQLAHTGQASIVPSADVTNTAHYPAGNARGTGAEAHEVGAATTTAIPPASSLTGCSGGSGRSPHSQHQLHYQTPLQQRRNMHAYQPSAPLKKPKKAKKKSQERKQDKKAAKTLSAILLAFILTWTPYNVLVLLKALTPCENECFPKELWDFSYYLCYINSTINPVCYALCNASFRRTYVRILTCKWHTRTKTAVQRGFYN